MSYSETKFTNIKSWAEEDRPREKLIQKGRQSLTDAELLAILIGSGTKNLSAVELARKLLFIADNHLLSLGKLSIEQLTKVKGIGDAKAITVIAALELGRRRQQQDALAENIIKTSKHAFDILSPCIADLNHEEFWVILLSRKSVVLKYKMITQGGFSGTIVDPRQIFNWAILEQASSIILAHNHPSGNLFPSELDRDITKKIVKAGEILGIQVVDHVIITSGGYYSFADHGAI
jgi:DNA repair protein RadC